MQDALCDSVCMRRFAGIAPDDNVPDSATLQEFRTYLKRRRLTSTLNTMAHHELREHRLAIRNGSIVEPTLLIEPTHN
jgi:IS5 family transposase